ncbi:hypothetical protein [Microbacterium halotolerans]|uniref:hypothetical protein n=1 Tax=Microbacterium halotolerans TaxID=246613 RepID=UPI000E6ADA65|nr:hypothetical protein [Microbacterium halotolerans]
MNEFDGLAQYRFAVAAALPGLVHLSDQDDAVLLLTQLDVPGADERRWLTSGMAFHAGMFLRATAVRRRRAARPWWAWWRRVALPDGAFVPDLSTGSGHGIVAAAQVVAAYADRRRDDAEALLEPWCSGRRDEDDYAELLGALLLHMRYAHGQLVACGGHS